MTLPSISFRVKPVYLENGDVQLGNWTLRWFQERVMNNLTRGRDTLLVAPTGSGKTLTLLLAGEGAVGIYPNNTLLLDQQRSIDKILREALGARITSKVSMGGIDILRLY
jgi:ATP-dependent helicase YprA (DUF1998 family)